MRKTFLSDKILRHIEAPARYIGGEWGSVVKPEGSYDIHFCMCFPDVYEIGMSHLGIQILYGMFNERADVYCERVYSPWPDLDAVMREEGIPLFSLETQTPIREFDFLGITIQYEMCYTNILQVIDLSGIPLRAADRKEGDTIVIGGGPCTVNAEPIADFFDIIYVGEGEISYDALFDLYKAVKAAGGTRREFLRRAGAIEGIYIPSLYEPGYNSDGTIASLDVLPDSADLLDSLALDEPLPAVPERVKRVVVTDFDKAFYPTKPVVPFIRATQDRVMLEIQRGCIRGCRFCQAGMIYRPNREKNVETLKRTALEMIKNTGDDEISLVSLSTSDYGELSELVEFILGDLKKNGIELSLPSLRIDAFSLDLMKQVKGVNNSSLTFAPEAGSQRMRDVINKGLTREDIMGGAEMAFKSGWNKVKLYFMLGLPMETDEDAAAISELGDDIAMLYYDTVPKDQRQGRCHITMSTSFFVPKPFTPFQWAPQATEEIFLHRSRVVADTLKERLNQRSITYNWHHAATTVIEGALARGDRRQSKVIEAVYKSGEIFSAWGEYFDVEKWKKAFEDTGLSLDFYTTRPREKDEIFPWDLIDCGLDKRFLWREWENALEGKVTPNCREQCSGCGSYGYGGGVCHERS
ncbi:MAG: TIGR03960 family B12-binding radical SAM protein [Eubacterium sp.]|nr:TIGR03960 family B12-binding radical SAM protein [Eubacterium sp.]